MFDLQKFVDSMCESSSRDRSAYHATLGDLIERLKNAKETDRLNPVIKGIGAYRGYYTDIVLCTEGGSNAYKEPIDYESDHHDEWFKENTIKFDFPENPKELAKVLESLIGSYFDGYKGGSHEIRLDRPLWLATDNSDCSQLAVIGITDDLKLETKIVD